MDDLRAGASFSLLSEVWTGGERQLPIEIDASVVFKAAELRFTFRRVTVHPLPLQTC